ncbi:alpha/beta hydrolase [Nakamurella endophytica]|uniref:Esterase n=1 Tax=Nakamurella endophytica TaxID=1748367 RepID=A0A917SM11_9ACTN|nr:alpha/beta hydrolase family protein [Nakamurella endophytica]GGL86358.1 esterase [Nakamurella endophytica]
MAHLRVDFFADSLALSTSMTVLLPQRTRSQIGMTGTVDDAAGGPPVLYLLHGLSDDDTIWLRRTSIERYVAELGWAVVMPQVHRSFYTDEQLGQAFWTFVSQELPEIVGSMFRVSQRREDTFVAGLSMGGYGAVKLALRQPERFAAAASLSGVLDLATRLGTPTPADTAMFTRIFGPAGVPTGDDDLVDLVRRCDPSTLPALWACCGTEDFLAGQNRTFERAAREAGIPLEVQWSPGEHEWGYWDRTVQDALRFFAAVRGGAVAG